MKTLVLRLFDNLNIFRFFNRYTSNTATVFMMHNIKRENEDDGGHLSSETLRNYFAYLKQHNYNVISLSDYIAALRGKKSISKTVVFTVDDGYRDFYFNAFPVFREYDFPATVFLTSDFIEKKIFLWWDLIEFIITETKSREIDLSFMGLDNFSLNGKNDRFRAIDLIVGRLKKVPDEAKLEITERLTNRLKVDISDQPEGKYAPLTWDEILEMHRCGIEFYPHTKTHPIMTRINYEQKLTELIESKNILEKKLNGNLDIFCYPNGGRGDFDDETIMALKETGYNAAVTGIAGFDSTKSETDFFKIHRYGIPLDTAIFKQYISGLEYLKYKYLY
ncbi:MAG: polysaccharide deacetylase family protein [Candidatus Zixiibacteriota bacterium]|nr:MAG: polysaccharide deacetylase family protein [candidate division Zixibacteria bacterium]